MFVAEKPSLREGYYAVPGARAASLETDLLASLHGDEIEVLFQPQYRVSDDKIYGAEALTRWRHPTLGTIGAPELFSVAERAGCVEQVSQRIFRIALSHASHWPKGLSLSLNATPGELIENRFVEKLSAMAAWARRDPASITVEITEDALLDDIERAGEASHRLQQLGFKVALDDFGAGFCNFSYLKRLSLDSLKLDRSMIEGLTYDDRDVAVLRGIVAMAKALSLDVVAEGVERGSQLEIIRQEGCHIYQGYLRATPMAPETFTQLVRR
ncbi:EAL domain-containing protein [Altererythrobacter sp. MF3-039]|uniref:EAL domain-containing protein n=1 Tax=Altererythrobacter sp. MF3-039 TaxID=3252901 RepID=UPI00390C4C85